MVGPASENMRGTRPEQNISQSADQLSKLELQTARESFPETQSVQPIQQTQKVTNKPEVALRFEQIMRQELERSASIESLNTPALGANIHRQVAANRPLNAARSLGQATTSKSAPLQGLTILDKLVSFVAYLLKLLEKRLFSAVKKLFPGQRALKREKLLKPLSPEREEKQTQKKSKSKDSRRGPAFQ